ncbi:ATP-binding protein [Pseudomonas moraviensis]|uniref:ATP-binding protein n=1 Tax=Pseudomonas moraviensis TaxID=321662 RepID=UPI00215EDADD|nr:ATP-binding protein [Pseudomonas moraviensis]UVL45057.1 ATP-binding protein [Pseudomonas moraviensis]
MSKASQLKTADKQFGEAVNFNHYMWPFRIDGQLPDEIFSSEHLDHVAFTLWPLAFKCPLVTIRGGLRTLIKKYAPQVLKKQESNQSDSPRSLINLFASTGQCRIRSKELSFIIEEPATRFGRHRARSKFYEPKRSFGELLGQAYCYDPEVKLLFNWFQKTALPRKKGELERYLTGDLLLSGFSENGCPFSANSVEFARMVLIYASVLTSPEEQVDLVKAAMSLGCMYLNKLLRNSSTEDSLSALQGAEKERLIENDNVQISAPILNSAVCNRADEIEEEFLVTAATESFRQATITAETALEAATFHYEGVTEALVNLPEEKWQVALSSIQNARSAFKEKSKLRNLVLEQESNCWSEIETFINVDAQNKNFSHENDDQLISFAISISKIKQKLSKLKPSFYQLYSWKEKCQGDITLTTLQELAANCENDYLNKQSREQYRLSFDTYAKSAGIESASDTLTSLDCNQLIALIAAEREHPWGVGEAIILRVAVEKGVDLSAVLDLITISDVKSRRILLSFIEPENAIVKSNIVLSRILAVERFRTVMLFEPVAQIFDLTSNLISVDVVGRSVYELAELISSNASILGSTADIARLIRQSPKINDALDSLLSFANTPATMQGNYRRLKEKARDALVRNVLKNGEINAKCISIFILQVESGELTYEVIAELSAERPDDQLESRHKEQLARYISQMLILLKDCLSESQHRPDQRLKVLASKVKKLHRQLRRSNDVGSIEWLEGQIAEILESPRRETSFQCIKAPAVLDFSSVWTEETTEFASQHIDIPEFYYSSTVFFRDIVASCIYWRALGSQPSSLEIAKALFGGGRISDAALFAKERNDSGVTDYILEVTAPIRNRLGDRAELIREQYGAHLIERLDEYEIYVNAMKALELSAASDALDLLELVASEALTNGVEQSAIDGRRDHLKKVLSNFEGGLFKTNSSLAELEKRWAEILSSKASERTHLTVVEKVFDSVEYFPANLESLLSTFKVENEYPERWLEENISHDFAEYAHEAADKLVFWAKSAPIMIPQEKSTTYIICEWFLTFIVERSLSIHQLDEVEGTSSAMDRIFEVSSTIVNAGSPGECANSLKDIGELPESLMLAIENGSSLRVVTQRPEDPEQYNNVDLAELIKLENWSAAVELCNKLTLKVDEPNLKGIFLAFSDMSTIPSQDAIEHLQSAASWISGSHELLVHLSESQRLSLAYFILSGAISADSSEDLARTPSSNGGWSEILGRSSAFRKMLITTVPFRVEKILETLLAGNLGFAIADRLWDAATNVNEPHLVRTPILSFMYEHGASEAICRLAARHDAVISTRLSQLFELRSVASARPDLIPVAQSVADQIVSSARSVPFRNFIKELPTAAQVVKPNLAVDYEGDLCLHDSKKNAVFELPIIVTPNGLVPVKLEASLFEGDDVYFEDGSLKADLSNRPTYFASDFTLRIKLGAPWFSKSRSKDGVRIRIRAKTLTDELFVEDIIFRVRSDDPKGYIGARLSTDTLLDLYPGVSNTPAIEDTFIGRHDELEMLNQVLVSAKRPSPVLLTGMRRIGKTSLLFAFHKRLRQPGNATAITFYLSLAERRVEFVGHQRTVSATLFRAISHGLVRPNLSITDQNFALCSRIRHRFDGDWKAARKSIEECYDEESLADSLIALSYKIVNWVGAPLERFVLLIDEAEALVAPYQAGGEKKLELEQLLQSLREVSQTTGTIGILLSGSNHINIFAREYKNAFFGSSQSIELSGLKDAKEASALIAPKRVSAFIQFDPAAIEYAYSLCAGMPQFLWQVGATVAHLVRVGTATKRDVRLAIAALIGDNKVELPFKAYEILEPIDSILSLESAREKDLLWMLLYRVASASSLVAEDATVPFVIDHALVSLDERLSWNRRLRSLVELKILRMESPMTVRFHVPLFGEGFRAKKHWQEYNARLQGVAQ